jgi:hypothetical protein
MHKFSKKGGKSRLLGFPPHATPVVQMLHFSPEVSKFFSHSFDEQTTGKSQVHAIFLTVVCVFQPLLCNP